MAIQMGIERVLSPDEPPTSSLWDEELLPTVQRRNTY